MIVSSYFYKAEFSNSKTRPPHLLAFFSFEFLYILVPYLPIEQIRALIV